MRRIAFVLLLVAFALPLQARAAVPPVPGGITISPSASFMPPSITIPHGTQLWYLNVSSGSSTTHDLTSVDGWFTTGPVQVRSLVPVPGTETLGVGTYPFLCTRHQGMVGTLVVE
ncbi:MAG: hypothetical protein ABR552_03490 [Actinomycetota bacterium]